MHVFGKLTVKDITTRIKAKVLCKCECGTEKWINIYNIIRGDVLSCGCLKKERMKQEAVKRFKNKHPSNYVDRTGKKIGVVTVVKRVREQDSETWWLLKCECGNEFESRISTLRRSKYSKCICGFKSHSLKKKLQQMIDRCRNPLSASYKYYGAKGIDVCEEWVKYPIKFIEWSLKNGWKPRLTIDRIDSSGNYSPENCRWISLQENSKKAAEERWALRNME